MDYKFTNLLSNFIQDYNSGLSLTQMEKKYGYKRQRIASLLKKAGVKIVNKQNSIKFINYLYNDCTIYLQRKFNLFNFFKNGSRSLKEFNELLQGKIGKTPLQDNTEINLEIKESKSLYSVESEP